MTCDVDHTFDAPNDALRDRARRTTLTQMTLQCKVICVSLASSSSGSQKRRGAWSGDAETVAKNRIPIWLALIVGAIGLLLAAILGSGHTRASRRRSCTRTRSRCDP